MILTELRGNDRCRLESCVTERGKSISHVANHCEGHDEYRIDDQQSVLLGESERMKGKGKT